MKRFMVAALLIAASTVGTASAARADDTPAGYWRGSTWNDPDRGFLWYAPAKPAKEAEKELNANPASRYAHMTNKQLGKEIERLLDLAVEQQSPEAVKEYLFLQQYAMDRASRFSDVFRRTVWTTPELDYSLRSRPTNAMAINTYDVERDGKRIVANAQLAQTHGLFFYFRGNCPYCHQLAPILRMYQRNSGMEIFPVSLDGGTLAEFPNARLDNGSAENLRITTVPAVFLADKRTGSIQPIGYGVLSLQELIERVYVLTSTQPGQEY